LIVAVTGATGFVGRHLLDALIRSDVSVRALARRAMPELDGGRVSVVRGDLADDEALARLVDGAEVVVHCAGVVAASRASTYDAVNVGGTAALLRAVGAATRIVHVSSLAAREPGLSAYAASKHHAERLMLGTGRPSTSIVRPPAVYGPGDRVTLPIFQQLRRGLLVAPAADAARFSLIFVADLASLLVELALTPFAAADPLEPDDGRKGGYAWSDLAAIAGEVMGRRVRTLHLPPRLLWPLAAGCEIWGRLTDRPPPLSRDKLRELGHRDWVCRPPGEPLGWQPRTGFARGYAQTAAWYARAGWL
jgi:nucleoside-diphosphate-sugar epimerase